MAQHTDLGKRGEELAADYLIKHGYAILHRNWRHGRYEIDIVAMSRKRPHFIEVNIRSTGKFGRPEESVTRKKIGFLLQAADEFLYRYPGYADFHIDILSITLRDKEPPEYVLIEDVYL